MHLDCRDLPNGSEIKGDICIVGAGTAGISMALQWINTPYKVILLESGGFEYEQKIQDLNGGTLSGQKYYPLKSTRLRYFGGTTGHWSGWSVPLDPIDFKYRNWVPESGWPFSREELDPYYKRTHEILELGPYEYDLKYWQKEVSDLNPLPLDKNVVWNKMWQFSKARFGTLYKDEIVNSKNVHLYTYANVVDITANENLTKVNKLTIKNHEGKVQNVKATNFVLACGAIQNARILLASDKQIPAGLGNSHDLVGRYFMEHLEIAAAELWLFKDFRTDLFTYKHNSTKARAELALTAEIQTEYKILNGTASVSPLSYNRFKRPRMVTWQDDDPRESWDNMINEGQIAQKKATEEGFTVTTQAFQLLTRIEQAPNRNSRVTLSHKKDALGVPFPNLNWELLPIDKRSIRTFYQIIGRQVGISGIGRIKLDDYLQDPDDTTWPEGTNGGWHHMGTTRMNENPEKGVVDANCKVHGLANLYIAGSGCYPTSGAANPTVTLVALSLRLADHLMDVIKK